MNVRRSGTGFLCFLFAVTALVVWPVNACAHLVTTGLGPVYDGIGHLVMTPEDLIPALALALFVGMRGADSGRQALFALPLSWFAGGLVGLYSTKLTAFQFPVVSVLVLGVLIALDMKLHFRLVTVLVLLIGSMHGILNGLALSDGPGVLGLVGISFTLFVLVALFSAFVVSLQKPWTRIAVRVAGSWIAAIGMLMVGWLVRGQV